MSIFARTHRGVLSQWWWTTDRWLILALFILTGLGFIMSIAASPAVAQKIDMPIYYFANKQFVFLTVALCVGLAVSFATPEQILRLAVVLFVVSLIAVIVTLFAGTTVKGATRWLRVGGMSVQPSEFLKPGFVVVTAWLMAHQNTRFDSRGIFISFASLIGIAFLLTRQPDFGQTALVVIVWLCLYFLSGASMRVLSALLVLTLCASALVYQTVPYVAERIDSFRNPHLGDSYQVDRAMDAIRAGGVLGAGLGDGRVKSMLPDAHSDYAFAVAAEETGLFGGLLIMAVFALVLRRGFVGLERVQSHWVQLAMAGLVCLFGMQSLINLGVNLNVLPSKGMTLPFISYGGSSLLASALTLGMLAGLARRDASSGARVFISTVDAIRPVSPQNTAQQGGAL